MSQTLFLSPQHGLSSNKIAGMITSCPVPQRCFCPSCSAARPSPVSRCFNEGWGGRLSLLLSQLFRFATANSRAAARAIRSVLRATPPAGR